MGRTRMAVLTGVGDDEHVLVGRALFHLLSCSATLGAAAAVVVSVDKYLHQVTTTMSENRQIRRRWIWLFGDGTTEDTRQENGIVTSGRESL